MAEEPQDPVDKIIDKYSRESVFRRALKNATDIAQSPGIAEDIAREARKYLDRGKPRER